MISLIKHYIPTKRRVMYIFLFLFILINTQVLLGQINLQAEIDNSSPALTFLQTYSRYTNSTENFPTNNLTICIGEENRTIFFRFIAEDKNSNLEINGGNVTWKLVSVVNGTDTTVPSFGSSFKELTLESIVSGTQISYLENLTLSNDGNKTTYKIITNITDTNNISVVNESFFTLHKTDCIRVEEDATLIAAQPYELNVDYFNVNIVVNENITGKIIVTLHNESPVDSNTLEALDKYVTVDVEGIILQNAVNLTLVVNYTEDDLEGKTIDEETLQIYKWVTGWNVQSGSVNTSVNQINFVINESILMNQSYRLGTYSVRGSQEQNTETPTGGGGGGGGGSPITGDAVSSPPTQEESSRSSDGTIELNVGLVEDEITNDKLNAIIELVNHDSDEEVTATVTYKIVNKNGEILYTEDELVTINGKVEIPKSFSVKGLSSEEYELVVEVQYGQNTEPLQSKENFLLKEEKNDEISIPLKISNCGSLFFICPLLLLLSVILFFLYNRERRKRKELEEKYENARKPTKNKFLARVEKEIKKIG